ncbi:MAG: hypothetical protein S4CHLAM6_13140 [Chlamydiae bacterium]|nr:hypothetical protein [Chlamydiota bacterium]
MRVTVALLLTVVGWSSSFVFIRLGLESYSAEVVTCGRYLVASLVAAVIYAYLPHKVSLSISNRIKAMLCGALGMGIYSYAVGLGEVTVPASITGFVVGLMPLCASVLAVFLYKEPLSKRLLMGIGISLIGLFIIAFSGHDEVSFGTGLLWVFLSTISATAYTLLQKPLIKKMPAPVFICHALWGGALIALIIYLLSSSSFIDQFHTSKFSATLSIFYLGFVPSLLSFFGWSYALSKVNVAKASIALYTMPLLTALLAFLILQEKPTLFALVGMSLAFGGSLIGSIKLSAKIKKSIKVTT